MRKVLASAAILAVAGSAMATNGDNMIGVTPASQAMGGIGVGMPIGSIDSIFRNPAWMNSEKGFTVSFGGILFMPSVKARYSDNGVGVGDTGYVSSRADFFTVPEIGITNRINDKVVVGIAAYGVSGMGTDYRNKDPRLANMHTTLQFMRIIPAVSYQINPNLSIGVGLDLAWGSLDMGATLCANRTNPATCWNAGGGQSSSYGIGAQIGLGYQMGDLSVGFNYQSPVSMKYKHVFFDSNGNGSYEDLKLQQPQEVAVGLGYKVMPNLKVGLDLRWINWSDADGYKQFKWKDQTVVAIGGEYQVSPSLKLRAGYNYGKSPIRSYSGLNGMPTNTIPNFVQPFSDFNVQWFNLIGFPAITEHHISFGGSYQFTKNFAVDLAYVHAFEKKVESSGQYCDMSGCYNATVGGKECSK
jgi:long-chain fatty acid transport protein